MKQCIIPTGFDFGLSH